MSEWKTMEEDGVTYYYKPFPQFDKVKHKKGSTTPKEEDCRLRIKMFDLSEDQDAINNNNH